MKILHVIPTIALEHGGPSHGVRMMATACAARGLEVEVAATSFGTPQGHEDPRRVWTYEEQAVRYRLFPRVTGSGWNLSLPLTRWLYASAGHYDVLHVHAPFSYPSLAACSAARYRRVPYVYRTLGTMDPWSLRHRAWKKWPYYQLLEKRNLRAAAVVHVTSEMERQALDDLGFGARTCAIGYGVQLPRAVQRSASETLRILFIGRLHPIKGLPVLLDAVAKLPDMSGRAWRLDIGGGGDDAHRAELEAQARSLGIAARVRFFGFVHGDEKARLLADSDVFVLPSHHENFGLAALEAMGVGLPAVVSDGVALSSEIDAAGAGIRFRDGDAGGLAAALGRYLDPTVRARAGERARGLVQERFTVEAMAGALERMYRGAAGRAVTTSDAAGTSARGR